MTIINDTTYIAETMEEALEQLNVDPQSIVLMLTIEEEGIGCHVQNPHMWPMKLKRTMMLALMSVIKEVQDSMGDNEDETIN